MPPVNRDTLKLNYKSQASPERNFALRLSERLEGPATHPIRQE